MTKTKIEWADEVWNPVTGCDRVSTGCDNCYAERIAIRFGRPFLGAVELHRDKLDDPLRWRKPRKVFVNSVSDLFHPDVPIEFITKTFAVMAAVETHTFQILTKRPQRMAQIVSRDGFNEDVWSALCALADDRDRPLNSLRRSAIRRRERAWLLPTQWPLPNVWLGTSVENQRYADLRIPHLLATPAAVRFLSVEPMLGPVDLDRFLLDVTRCSTCEGRMSVPVEGGGMACPDCFDDPHGQGAHTTRAIDWVIVGGESGPGARPMHVQWARDLRDQCAAATVPFFFKQWGEWGWPAHPGDHHLLIDGRLLEPDARLGMDHLMRPTFVRRVGKKAAGRDLDGRTWDEYPA